MERVLQVAVLTRHPLQLLKAVAQGVARHVLLLCAGFGEHALLLQKERRGGQGHTAVYLQKV